MAENENMKEFTPEETTNQEPETNVAPQEPKKELWLIRKWKALKFWQKALVISILAAGSVAGIYKLIKSKPEVVAEAIEQVAENPEVVSEVVDGVEVTTF